MSLEKYKAWCPDHCGEEDAHEFTSVDAEDAATDYLDAHHSDHSYAEEVEVHVRCPSGTLRIFDVSAVPSITFSAKERTS